MQDLKSKLQEVFNRLFPNCELYSIHLNNFSHKVFYKDQQGNRHIDGYSQYAPEQYIEKYIDEGGNIESFNKDRTKVLFAGVSHSYHEYFTYSSKKWVK